MGRWWRFGPRGPLVPVGTVSHPPFLGLPDAADRDREDSPLPRRWRLKPAARRRPLTAQLQPNAPQTRHRLSMAYSLLRRTVSTAQIPVIVGRLGQRLDDQNRGGGNNAMEAQPLSIPPTPVTEIGSLVRAVEAERAGRYVEAWHEALKAIALRPFHPEAYIQMASTAVAAGDPEAGLRAAQRALALTPKWTTAQQVVAALERTLNAHRKQRKQANPIAWPALSDPNRKPRLSVCMIVKNEERFLGQCLASVKDIADELIVIDTGSTDRTLEIAREHGAQVGHFEWCNDFVAARNASIALATGDWILFLDADDELSPAEKQALPALLNSDNVALIRLPLIDTHQGKVSKPILPSLFRNIPAIQFQGCVHEGVYTALLKVSKEWQMDISVGDLLILHHGYTAEVIAERNKFQRNHELLVKVLKERPNEAYFYMQLGLELRRMDRLAESLDAYAMALNLAETQPNQIITDEVRETLLTQYSGYLLADKQYEKVVEVLTSDLTLRQPRP